jgi:hypothetical protein
VLHPRGERNASRLAWAVYLRIALGSIWLRLLYHRRLEGLEAFIELVRSDQRSARITD